MNIINFILFWYQPYKFILCTFQRLYGLYFHSLLAEREIESHYQSNEIEPTTFAELSSPT